MTSDPPIADRYVLGEPIGRGGMGQVYRAWDTVLDKAVAVKLLADRSPSGEALERFRREAAASARLGHEHIVVTHDVVPLPGGSIALVMELVEGPSLREWLHERGPFDPATVIELARQLADGLAAVHRIGIVHRDLKPANVMVDRGPGGPRLKIADFGIASLPETAQLTRAGTVLGTPEYMAPERFRGAAPTPAMDVYALGVIVHELWTGEPPLTGDSPLELVAELVQRTRHPLDVDHPEVRGFLEAALDFDPSARLADGAAAVERLQALAAAVPERSVDEAIVVVGGVPVDALRAWAAGTGEMGQALQSDVVVRFEAPELAFRRVRDLLHAHPSLRGAFDAGPIVGAGVGLFAGAAVGRAARLARVARPGDVLVGPGGRRAIGLGLRGELDAFGAMHLAGVPRDTLVHRIRTAAAPAPTRHEVRVVDGRGEVVCGCQRRIEVSLEHAAQGARIACTACGQVLSLEPVGENVTLAAPVHTRDAVLAPEADSDADILSLLGDAR